MHTHAHNDDARARPSRRRLWRILLLVPGVLVLSLGLFEATLRLAIHQPASQRVPGLWALSRPSHFGAYGSDDAHWEVLSLSGPAWARRGHRDHDERLGWRSAQFRAGDLEHVREAELGERRPMILLGDSYAEGVAPQTQDDFPALLARSELAGEFLMLNYGVGGWGLDQIALLLPGVLQRHAARRPVVLVSFLLDDDLDRCILSFRSWPKPRLRLEDGRLVGAERPVPSTAEYFAERSALEPLYLWPFLRTLWGRVDASRARAQEREKQELARALLRSMVADLRAAEVDFLFVLFRYSSSIEWPDSTGWRRQVCGEVLDELEAPYVDVGPAFALHRSLVGRATADYFLPPDHPIPGHYNPLGDALAFETVLEGLHEHHGLGRGGNLHLAQDVRSIAGREPTASWLERSGDFDALGLKPPWVEMDLDADGRGGLTWELRGAASSLRARVHLLGDTAGGGAVRLRVRRDGVDADAWTILEGEPLEFALDLADVRRLELVADERRGDPALRVVLGEVALEFAGRVAPPIR